MAQTLTQDDLNAIVAAITAARPSVSAPVRPAGWPVSFHCTAHNNTDDFNDVTMVWYDDLGDPAVNGCVPDEIFYGALRGRGGYYSARGNPSGLFGVCFNGRMVLLLNDGGDYAGEWYGSYAWDGSGWSDRQTTGFDPSPAGVLNAPGSWDLSTWVNPPITVSFSTYIGDMFAKLSADGLDDVAAPQTTGRPTTFPGMVRRVFEWAANKKTRDRSTGLKKVYGTDGTTLLETQTQSTSGTTDQETQGT